MSRHCCWWLVILWATVGLASAGGLQGAEGDKRPPPNIVFLLSDDQTFRAAGCYGNPQIITPHLDQLASQGVRFTNHYNTTSICMASRCSVLTGLYEYRHGCNFDHGDLQPRFMQQSYPVLLRQAGYFTGMAGKVGFELQGEKFETLATYFEAWAGGPGQTFYETEKNAGIAEYASQYPHSSRAYGAWSQDFFRRAAASGKPFCLSISFKAPHLPFTPDPIDVAQYAGKSFTPPPNYGAINARHLSPQSQTSRAATGYREWVDDYQETLRKYYALITGVDAALGMIRQGLAEQGLSDNTVIIFTSDNGYNSGSHGFGDKVIPYEEGSKSPLVIYDPRLPESAAGGVCHALTANVDMAATICGLAGVPLPADSDGRDLRPLLTNPEGHVRSSLPLFNFWGTPSAQSMAIVTPGWKYIYWYYAGQGMPATEELFPLASDPYEMVTVANDPQYAQQLASMRQLYAEELQRISERRVEGHGYEPYPILFAREQSWERKAEVLDALKGARRGSETSEKGAK